MRATLSWDTSADQMFGFGLITNYPDDEDTPPEHTEVAFLTIFVGALWIHTTLYRKNRGVKGRSKSWQISYQRGVGWLNTLGRQHY